MRMSSIYLTILPNKPSLNGEFPIRIAINHKRKTCYITTKYKVTSLNQFKNGQIIKRRDATEINIKLRSLISEYQARLDNIRSTELYTCQQLKEMIQSNYAEKGQTFKAACDDFLTELQSEGRFSYATSIERNCRYFLEFAKGDVILSDITPIMIRNYAGFIKKRGVSNATVNTMLAQTKSVINRAIREQLVSYQIHPFITTKISSAPVRKLDLSLSNFNKIRLSEPDKRKHIMAKDLFCLSFYLGGINLIDLMSLDFRKEIVEYTRAKTESRVQIDSMTSLSIPEPAKPIIRK